MPDVTCAYCGSNGPMTREHVIPRFMYLYWKKSTDVIGWNESAERMLPSEQVIKDVCRRCNNGILGPLDAYAQEFLTNNGILATNFTRERIRLSYDYDRLLRWNLKVSYNSARRTRRQSHILEPFVPYIVLGDIADRPKNISAFVHLSGGHKFSPSARQKLRKEGVIDRQGLCSPFLVRISCGEDHFGGFGGLLLRQNTWGMLVFSMLIFDEGLSAEKVEQRTEAFRRSQPRMRTLIPDAQSIDLRRTRTSWMQDYEVQIRRQIAIGSHATY